MQKNDQRRDRLIQPRLQLRLILAFLGVAATALLLQFVLFASVIATTASELPTDGQIMLERTTGLSITIFIVSICILLPLCFFVGVLVTFRVAGPLYRFEKYLESVARGVDPGICRIRKGDDLQEFCVVLNAAMDRMRSREALRDPREAPRTLDEAA